MVPNTSSKRSSLPSQSVNSSPSVDRAHTNTKEARDINSGQGQRTHEPPDSPSGDTLNLSYADRLRLKLLVWRLRRLRKKGELRVNRRNRHQTEMCRRAIADLLEEVEFYDDDELVTLQTVQTWDVAKMLEFIDFAINEIETIKKN